MKRIKSFIAASFLVFLIPFTIASGQEKKTEQRIKIVIANEGGPDVILDTLITGKPLSDSILLKNGQTIYLAHEESDNSDCKHAGCGSKGTGKTFTYTIDSGTMEKDSEKTKYVIARDGIRITVEGSDYDKVKDVIKDIEKTLDSKTEAK